MWEAEATGGGGVSGLRVNILLSTNTINMCINSRATCLLHQHPDGRGPRNGRKWRAGERRRRGHLICKDCQGEGVCVCGGGRMCVCVGGGGAVAMPHMYKGSFDIA